MDTVDAAAAAATNPTATDDAAATSSEPLYPAWVLLQKEVHYGDRENATTAEAQAFIGRTVRVTFFLADPPAVSYFAAHGPELEQEDILVLPRAVFSAKDLVLFRFVFTVRPRSTVVPAHNPAQYFVYKAAGRHGGKPSLTPVPPSDRPQNAPSHPSVLPFEDEAGNFLVADLATAGPGRYHLHILSSKTNKWITRTLQLQAPPGVINADLPGQPDKVIALGAGTIGWIDLWRGIVVCDVFDLDPVLRFIPLPKPQFNLRLKGGPQQIRDVTCCNGFIKFIEMECYPRPDSKGNFKMTKDLDTAHVLHDSELFFRSSEDLMEEPGPRTFRTCYRHTSWNLWCKGHTVHVNDILVKTPGYYTMLPELWDHNAGKFTLRNLIAVCPVLSNSIHGGDVVYFVSKVRMYDEEAWVVAVDLRKKTVEVLEPYRVRSIVHQNSFLACTFPGYLNSSPRSCAPEDGCGQNCPLSPGNIIQNNLNMQIVHPVDSFQLQPQLVVPTHSFPQTPRYKFIPTGPAVPFNTLMPPVPAYPAMPFTLMPRVPMDEGFLSQVSLVPVSPSAPFNTMMPLVLTDDRLLSQMPPVPTVHHSLP
ncbi:unnamed protein product [Alopecurus aequalis]